MSTLAFDCGCEVNTDTKEVIWECAERQRLEARFSALFYDKAAAGEEINEDAAGDALADLWAHFPIPN